MLESHKNAIDTPRKSSTIFEYVSATLQRDSATVQWVLHYTSIVGAEHVKQANMTIAIGGYGQPLPPKKSRFFANNSAATETLKFCMDSVVTTL